MKLFFDFLPILLFFVAYKVYDIYIATAVIIVATIVQVAWHWFKHRKIENMHIITLVLVVTLGGLTLLLQDENFIKWKPTIVNWAFAIAFLGSQFIGKKNLLQRMLDSQITVSSPKVWINLNFAWIAFFTVIGFVNLYVAFNYDTNTWVNFKLFGMLGLTILFVIGQSFYLTRYIVMDDESNKDV
ncbi:MAG: septation protein A [Candidatus Marithrix sp.]|nr:septation protein A [Candidatus Marithrix sp.]